MPALLDLLLNPLLVFVLVLTRVSGLVMLVPVLGARGVPMQIRGLLAVAMALFITPLYWSVPVGNPGSLLNMLVLIGCEALLGLALGLGVLILFTGLQLAGQIISQMGGMSLADVFDPSFDGNVPVLGQFLDMMTLAVFVIVGGHRQVLTALLDTFQWLPPGQAGWSPGVVDGLVEVTTQSFLMGLRVAAPVMVALLTAVLILGLISRTLPQLNVLAVGFSLNSMVMLAALMFSLSAVVWIFQEQTETALETLRGVLIAEP